jgi:hypothetical protein
LLAWSLARLCIAPAHVSLWLKNQPKFQQTTTKKGSVNSSHEEETTCNKPCPPGQFRDESKSSGHEEGSGLYTIVPALLRVWKSQRCSARHEARILRVFGVAFVMFAALAVHAACGIEDVLRIEAA